MSVCIRHADWLWCYLWEPINNSSGKPNKCHWSTMSSVWVTQHTDWHLPASPGSRTCYLWNNIHSTHILFNDHSFWSLSVKYDNVIYVAHHISMPASSPTDHRQQPRNSFFTTHCRHNLPQLEGQSTRARHPCVFKPVCNWSVLWCDLRFQQQLSPSLAWLTNSSDLTILTPCPSSMYHFIWAVL